MPINRSLKVNPQLKLCILGPKPHLKGSEVSLYYTILGDR